MPDFNVAVGETITINVTGVAAAANAAAAGNNVNYPNAAANGASNNSQYGGVYRRNRNRKNKTNRRNRKNKTNRRN